jgi:hypothetical protein
MWLAPRSDRASAARWRRLCRLCRKGTQIGTKTELLGHNGDALLLRLAWRRDETEFAVDENVAVVRPINASQNLDQSALAGAVLAANAANFTGAHLKRDVFERDNRAECFRNIADAHDRRGDTVDDFVCGIRLIKHCNRREPRS